ncbi:MAG: DUF2079 domain-containing protein, partial [Candidatus Eremiobacteraeota bacterium]|nr:DUF2079 domain-containing protein [Candidatus Eremiobacteraeota bacterium]
GSVGYRTDARRRNFAIGVAAAAACVAALFFFVIQPHANANPAWQPTRFYSWTQDDLATLFRRGLFERAGFLLLVFAPLAFLPFRSRAIVLAIPPLLEVVLSRMNATFTLGSHYAGAWMGYVFFAFALAVRGRRALWWALGLCAVELLVANPMHPGLNLRARQPRDAMLEVALHALPRDVSVATQEEAYTHMALDNPYARLLPELAEQETHACFILVDRDFPDSPRLVEYGPSLAQLVEQGQYVLVDRLGAIEFYRSVAECR